MSDEQRGFSRRAYLQGVSGVATAGAAGFAGCLSVSDSEQSTEQSSGETGGLDRLRVAYMPIYPDMQYFVMKQEEYFTEIGAPVEGKVFSDGPSIVQAFLTGEFDVAMFGIVPAMVVLDKGLPAKITAANIEEAMLIMASDEFAALWKEHGKDAFAEFEAQKGRKFTFGTFPPGSVPDILLRFWLEQELGLDPEEAVEIKALAGAGPVRQALLAERIDGTSIMEPVPTVVTENDAPYKTIAKAGDFMPGQPAAVTLMHDRLRKDNPEIAKSFLAQHIKATQLTNDQPNRAAEHASEVIGSESLPLDIAKKAMKSPGSNFISDPHAIEDGAKTFSEYAARLDKISEELAIDDMFDYTLYDEVA